MTRRESQTTQITSGYLFWLGLPSLLFIGATTWVSYRFADHLPERQAMVARATA